MLFKRNLINTIKKTSEDYEDIIEIDWVSYMLAAKEMCISEEEFWDTDPIFFNKLYEKYQENKIKEMKLNGR